MVLTNNIRTLSTWSNVVINKSRIALNSLECVDLYPLPSKAWDTLEDRLRGHQMGTS